MPTPREEMQVVARRLQPLEVPFVFVGGAVMWALVDHPELTQFSSTKDVDVVVGVVTYNQYAALEERLRKNGFQHDTSRGAPICRWIVDGCRVDIMPQDPANLGMKTRWFPEAQVNSQKLRSTLISPMLCMGTCPNVIGSHWCEVGSRKSQGFLRTRSIIPGPWPKTDKKGACLQGLFALPIRRQKRAKDGSEESSV